jgi:hypothetical protein
METKKKSLIETYNNYKKTKQLKQTNMETKLPIL